MLIVMANRPAFGFGGKITTYRKLAEHALQKLKPFPAMRN
jgi:glycerol-3-phosphate dehydrogenase